MQQGGAYTQGWFHRKRSLKITGKGVDKEICSRNARGNEQEYRGKVIYKNSACAGTQQGCSRNEQGRSRTAQKTQRECGRREDNSTIASQQEQKQGCSKGGSRNAAGMQQKQAGMQNDCEDVTAGMWQEKATGTQARLQQECRRN